jgi:hypothetical protein
VEFGPLNPPQVSAARRRRRRVGLFIVFAAVAVVVSRQWSGRPERADGDEAAPSLAVRPARVVPDTVRIKVEVLNATATRGLGRLATAWLRDQGFDVVGTGTAPSAERRDSTLVLDRSGHADWARLAAEAMGGARVEARPDSLRTSTHCADRPVWRPPPQSLYP